MNCNLNARNLADGGLAGLTTLARDTPCVTLRYGDYAQLEDVLDTLALRQVKNRRGDGRKADELNWPNYQHSDLFRPYAGIEFGTFFLAENLGRFDGNAQAALAGYNAGPGRAQNWLDLSGGDPDQFMTAITIDSTRTYVQRIYGFYSIYRSLYGQS